MQLEELRDLCSVDEELRPDIILLPSVSIIGILNMYIILSLLGHLRMWGIHPVSLVEVPDKDGSRQDGPGWRPETLLGLTSVPSISDHDICKARKPMASSTSVDFMLERRLYPQFVQEKVEKS